MCDNDFRSVIRLLYVDNLQKTYNNNILEKKDFIYRYINGEDFDSAKLRGMDFDPNISRNIGFYLSNNDPTDVTCLAWN